MIACNACQLLATNLPVCHSCLLDLSSGPFMCVLMRLFFEVGSVMDRMGLKRLFNSQHDLRWRSWRWRLYWFSQYFRGFDVFILTSFFTRFKVQDGLQNRLNLAGLGGMLASTANMLPLESNISPSPARFNLFLKPS